ncbi:MAG: S-formylglutathione hydrolase, partial [Deltaproteobacteria bacterium]
MGVVRAVSETRASRGVQGFYQHDSEACGGPMRFSVYMPDGVKDPPVVYYLAGLTCTEETFPIKAGARPAADELGLALVCCDTSPRAARNPGDDEAWDFGLGAGFYVDATEAPWSATYRMHSYVARELPALIEAHFPVRKGIRGIFGHSMGGHGALVAALRNPGVFASVSALAPIAAPSRCPWGEKAFGRYLGPDRKQWAFYDATALIDGGARAPKLLVDQGLADQFLATQLLPEALEDACERAGQPLTLRRHAGYDHSYYFVST